MLFLEKVRKIIPIKYRIFSRCFFGTFMKTKPFHSYVFKYNFKRQEKYYICRAELSYGVVNVLKHYVFVHSFLKRNGFIPVLDYEHEYYFSQKKIGVVSTWDELFDQEITVKDAMSKGRVFVGYLNLYDGNDADKCMFLNNNPNDSLIRIEENNWKEYYAKAKSLIEPIWKPKAELIDIADKIIGDKRCIGVALRENFSVDAWKIYSEEAIQNQYSKHPLSCGLEDAIKLIKEKKELWEIDYIFLSSRYIESCDRFKDEFGDKVIWVDRERMLLDNMKIANVVEEKDCKYLFNNYYNPESDIEQRKSYIIELMCLAKCEYLIGAPSGSVTGALMLNGGKYKDIDIFENLNGVNY